MKEKGQIKRKRTIWVYLVAFCIPVVCLLIFMASTKCYPFGDNTVLVGDANIQYRFFYTELYDRIIHGKSLLFSWDGGMGYDFYSNMMYYLASPFSIIVILLGGYSIELGMVLVLLIQMGGCAVTMAYYLRHTYLNSLEHGKVNDWLTIVFSLAYAMSNFILAYKHNIMWLISLMLAPLVMLGVEKLIRKNDCRLYTITLCLTLITNFYFAWFVCILSVLWFIDQNEGKFKDCLNRFMKWAGCSVLSAMTAAAVLIPCYFAVSGRSDLYSDINFVSVKSLVDIGSFVQSFFWGYSINPAGSFIFTKNNYCGIIVLIFALLYFFNNKIVLKSKLKRLLILGIMTLALNWSVGVYIFHGFAYPRNVSNRDSFILILLLIVTAFESICRLEKSWSYYRIIICSVIIGGLTVYSMFFNTNIQNFECYFVSFVVMMYIASCCILYKRKSIRKIHLLVNIAMVGILELISNAIYENAYWNSMVSNVPHAVESNEKEWKQIYNEISEKTGERKTSWINSDMNMAYSDTDIASSSKNMDMVWLFKKMGLLYQENGVSYAYRGTTPVTASMFNVRNVLTDVPANYGGYSVKKTYDINEPDGEIDKLTLLENEYEIGLGYVVSDDIEKWQGNGENPFENQNEFATLATGVSEIFTKVDVPDGKFSGVSSAILTETWEKCTYLCANMGTYAGAKYSMVAKENAHIYAYVTGKESISTEVYIDNVRYKKFDYYPMRGEILDIGEIKCGQKIDIYGYENLVPGSTGEMNVVLYKVNEQVLKKYISEITSHVFDVRVNNDLSIVGNINADKDGILYLAIPYYKGFKICIDGKKSSMKRVGDAVIGLSITQGEHKIVISYFTYGLKSGIVVSLLGLLGIIFIIKRQLKLNIRIYDSTGAIKHDIK